jgi:hypothetical protein
MISLVIANKGADGSIKGVPLELVEKIADAFEKRRAGLN